jgi:putative serine protease PepD
MDLAVIKADKTGLTPAELGDSQELNVGDQVVAFGSPLGLEGTVTSGIVSALQRPVRTDSADPTTNTVIDAIQTDAAINPGNSGGPLVDMQGRVVGINTAIASLGSAAGGPAGSIGLGFAIPINQAREIAKELVDTGRATHARLGVTVAGVRETDGLQSGALIRDVEPGGVAAQAGIQPDDVVVKLDDRRVKDADSLVAGIRSYRPGDKVTIVVERNGDQQTIEVTLGSDENARTS